MPLDTSIPLMVKPSGIDIMGSYQNALAMQDAQMKRQVTQQELQRQSQLRNFLASANLEDPATRNRLAALDPERAQQVEQMYAHRSAGNKSDFELASAKHQEFLHTLTGLAASNADYNTVISAVDDLVGRGVLSQQAGEHYKTILPQDPAQLQARLRRGAMERVGPEQIMDMFGPVKGVEVKAGGTTGFYNPRTGERIGKPINVTASPSDTETARHNREMERLQGAQEKRLSANVDASAQLAPKERQKREAAFPQAQASYNAAANEIDTLRNDLLALRAHPGLAGITGGIEGRMPSLFPKASAAQAKLDKILARGQFRELQNLRANSPTGAAVGNVSDKEGAALRASFGALDQKQSLEDFQLAIDDVIKQLDFSKNNITQSFDDTYAYRQGAAPTAGAPKAPVVGTVEDGHRFKGGDPKNPANWEPL